MFACVCLVRLLRADGDDATAEMRGGIASAAYAERSDDSAATMLQGSVRRHNAKQELSQRRQVRDDGAATMLQG